MASLSQVLRTARDSNFNALESYEAGDDVLQQNVHKITVLAVQASDTMVAILSRPSLDEEGIGLATEAFGVFLRCWAKFQEFRDAGARTGFDWEVHRDGLFRLFQGVKFGAYVLSDAKAETRLRNQSKKNAGRKPSKDRQQLQAVLKLLTPEQLKALEAMEGGEQEQDDTKAGLCKAS